MTREGSGLPTEKATDCVTWNVRSGASCSSWHREQSLATGSVWWQLRQSERVRTVRPPCSSVLLWQFPHSTSRCREWLKRVPSWASWNPGGWAHQPMPAPSRGSAAGAGTSPAEISAAADVSGGGGDVSGSGDRTSRGGSEIVRLSRSIPA